MLASVIRMQQSTFMLTQIIFKHALRVVRMQELGDGKDTLVGRSDPIPDGTGPIYVSQSC
jgi:hypothetical protein